MAKPATERKSALQVVLEPETHLLFKSVCAIRGLKMAEVTRGLVEDWLAQQTKQYPYLDPNKKVS